jgi:hypothetical protein
MLWRGRDMIASSASWCLTGCARQFSIQLDDAVLNVSILRMSPNMAVVQLGPEPGPFFCPCHWLWRALHTAILSLLPSTFPRRKILLFEENGSL